MLITKLDLNHVTPKVAKACALRFYGVVLTGRTREDVVRSIKKNMTAATNGSGNPN